MTNAMILTKEFTYYYNLNTDLTGSEIQREESSFILMQVKARFTDMEARETIPATNT